MLITTIFYHTDNFCKRSEKELSRYFLPNRKRKRKTRLTLSEILTICIYFQCSGYKNFKTYYCQHVCKVLRTAFPTLVSYNRFVELQREAVIPLRLLSIYLNQKQYHGIAFIDSTPLRVCHIKRSYSHKTFKNIAAKSRTSVGYFFGFKLHVIIANTGEIISFTITKANVADNNPHLIGSLTKTVTGKLFGDRGYIINNKLRNNLFSRGLSVITRIRSNMKNCLMHIYDKLMLKKRGVIESVFAILKETFSIEHSRHRSNTGFLVNAYSALIAYAFKSSKPKVNLQNKVLLDAIS